MRCTYMPDKKTTGGYGLPLIDLTIYISFVSGDRSTRTVLKLWCTLKCVNINNFASDYWKSYKKFISQKQFAPRIKSTQLTIAVF
jgi:IS1 family transposase